MSFGYVHSQDKREFYVAINGSDLASGSIQHPFSTIFRAQSVIRALKSDKSIKEIFINFRQGIYRLSRPVEFTSLDGGNEKLKICYRAFKNEKVIFSGGEVLSGVWQKISDEKAGYIWKLNVNKFLNRNGVFRSLFVDSERLRRSSSQIFYTNGGLSEFQKSYGVYDFVSLRHLTRDSINAFCGFTYSGKDLDKLYDTFSDEVIIYHSWDASWHTIKKVDVRKSTLYLENPMTYPIGFFNKRVRYRIENSKSNLSRSGEWCLDKREGKLYYFSQKGENPNKRKFIIPVLYSLMVFNGTAQPVCGISINGISFSHSRGNWGVHEVTPETIVPSAQSLNDVNLKEGYSSIQASMSCGQSVLLNRANNIEFNNCSFSQIDNYAMRIGEGSNNNTIFNCKFCDVGGGGVIVGFDNYTKPLNDTNDIKLASNIRINDLGIETLSNLSPSGNSVINCTFSNLGVIYPSGVGIGIMQANHTRLISNTISNLPYSGISVGWWYGNLNVFNSFNEISNNRISNVMKLLADGGGIYTIGRQTGSVYRKNYISNISKFKDAIGADNNGFFFDQGSRDFTVDSNVVMHVKNGDIRFNGAKKTDIKIGNNSFEKTDHNQKIIDLLKHN